MVNYDTPRHHVNFVQTDFDIHPHSESLDLQSYAVTRSRLPYLYIIVCYYGDVVTATDQVFAWDM